MTAGAIPILCVDGVLLATIHVDLDDRLAEVFQHDLLKRIEATGAKAMVVDVTGLTEVDTYVARVLAETAAMARLMGARAVIVGLRPSVAATLVRMRYFMSGVETALDVDAGLALLRTPAPAGR
ncbi:MAG: STAS domain-containing protein [Polyangiales bacterium]